MNGTLADRARVLAERRPPRTPERRAAAAPWARSVDPVTRAAAVVLLDELGGEAM